MPLLFFSPLMSSCAESICSTNEILCAERVLSREIIDLFTDMIISGLGEPCRVFIS